jgi:hypothetical protein
MSFRLFVFKQEFSFKRLLSFISLKLLLIFSVCPRGRVIDLNGKNGSQSFFLKDTKMMEVTLCLSFGWSCDEVL